MVTRWGMSDKLGMVQLAPPQNPYLGMESFAGPKPYSEDTARIIDAEVRSIIAASEEQARKLLTAHRHELDALVEALLAQETLDERQILEVTGLPPAPALESERVAAATEPARRTTATH
jgi:cell division protease FtsH